MATSARAEVTWSMTEAGPRTVTVSGVTTIGPTSSLDGVGPVTMLTLTGLSRTGSRRIWTLGGSQLRTVKRGSTDSTLTGTIVGPPCGLTSFRSTVAWKLSGDARAVGSPIAT